MAPALPFLVLSSLAAFAAATKSPSAELLGRGRLGSRGRWRNGHGRHDSRGSRGAAPALRDVPAGTLFGVFSNGETGGCDLHSISPSSDDNTTIASSLSFCDGITQYFPSASAYDSVAKRLVVAIGTGANIVSVDVATGGSTPLAPMPPGGLNDTNWPLGMVFVQRKLYIVFQTGIFEVAGGALKDLGFQVSFPQYAQVAASSPTCPPNFTLQAP